MKRTGFTLLELMAAVLICSIVVIAAYTLLTSSSTKLRDEQERRVLEANLRNAELLLQRDLSRIGYRVPFDSNEVNTTPAGRYLADSNETFQTFMVYKTTTAKKEPQAWEGYSQAIRYAGFTIVANFTDYDGFQVSSASGTMLTLVSSLKLPLTASDIGSLSDSTQPTMQSSSAAVFDSAFKRAFKHAVGVHIASTTYAWVVTKLASEMTQDGNATAISSSNGYTVHVKSSAPTDLGFNGTYNSALINPITAVTYKVVPNDKHYNTGDQAQETNYDLLRCYNTKLINPTLSDTVACQVLLHNVVYFDLYPLLSENLATSVFNDVYTNDQFGVAKAPGFKDEFTDHFWEHKMLKDFHGVYYRIGVAGDHAVRQGTTSMGGGQKSYTADGRPIMHIQGTSIVKTKNTATAGTENQSTLGLMKP